jgi:phage protein D/phage baseplate assembly protein gpV
MSETSELASKIFIKIDGNEVQRPVTQQLVEVVVDQHTQLPGMFSIRLHDPRLELLERGPFDLTKEVEITAENDAGDKSVLVKGEITALEPDFASGMIAELIVRGYDRTHRLYREEKSRAFLNVKDSDLAARIAQEAGIPAEVEQTSIPYDHIYQHNQSDLDFLMQRAWRIGFECHLSGGKLYFRKPVTGSAKTTLTWGDDLLSFRPRMTLAEQVDEVIVKGWDVEKKAPIVGKAQKGNLYPQIQEAKDGAGWAKAFGVGRLVIVDQPVVSQAEADALAAARLDELSGAFVEAEGTAFRRPEISAGVTVQLQGLGKRFNGTYFITNAVHHYTPEGLTTTFHVRGTRTGLLTEQVTRQTPPGRWPGAVTAIVTNTADPHEWGRVKVKFPWMADDAESDWARVLGIGAGPEAGLYAIPDVGDEVLVAFLHGYFSQPVILGGLWNGQNQLPPEAAGAADGEEPLVHIWQSRKGHRLALFDDAGKKIEIVTSAGLSITLDDNNKTITLKAPGVEVGLANNKLTVESDTEITIKAGSGLKLEAGGSIDIKANGQVNVKGATINLN